MRGIVLAGIALSTLLFQGYQFAQRPTVTKAEGIYVGFLDDARIELANWEPGVAHQRVVRPAFEKIGSAWLPVSSSSIPYRMTWTVAYHGKTLGRLQSNTVPEKTIPGRRGDGYLTFVQIILTPPAAVPSVGQPSGDFAGLLAGGPGAVRRPLVLVSKPYYHDPDSWHKLNRLPRYVAANVRKQFRNDFPSVDRCKDEEIIKHNWIFPDSSLHLPTAYASNKSTFLVETDLDAGDCGYVDDPNDPQSGPWYFVSAGGVARRIGSFMEFLDAGDYDNDGRSEVIFFRSRGENTDGFVLFDDHLQKQTKLIWHYH